MGPVSPRTAESPASDGGGPEPLGWLHVCSEPFAGYAATDNTAVIIGYVPGNATLYDQYGLTAWSGPLPVGFYRGFLMDTGPLVACADAPFSLLMGSSYRTIPGSAGIAGGAFVVDANGSGTSRNFYLYTAGALDPGVTHTVIFAYENNTTVVLTDSGRPVWSGTLNRGEHHVETGLSNRLLRVESDRAVAVLGGVDPEYPEYFAPSETGLFAGTRFLTWVPNLGSPITSDIFQVMGYYNDTRVTVTFPDTGAVAWSGVLDNGTVAELPNHPDEYVEVSSSKPVTVSSLAKGGGNSQMEFVADAAGLRFGKDFLTPTQVGPSSSLGLFSPLSGTRVELYNATSRALVATYFLGAGEYRFVDPTGLTGNYTRVRSNNPISVLFGLAPGSATYAPVVAPAALPDLSVQASDIVIDSAGPLRAGVPAMINATVRNTGFGPAGAFATRFFLGGPAGTRIGDDSFSLSRLPPSGAVAARVPWTPTFAGSQHVCVLADAEDYVAETDEADNAACVDVVIAPPLPDYAIVDSWPPSPAVSGLSRPVTLSLNVENLGNGTTNATVRLAFANASTPTLPFASAGVPPIPLGGVAGPYAATWTAPAVPGTYGVTALVDYDNVLTESNESNNAYTWTIDVVPGPVTSLVIGTPNVTAPATYITSSTLLSFSVFDPGGTGIRNTTYRVDGGPWTNFTATGPFTLQREGGHLIEWLSVDWAGNMEPARNATLRVDDTPPTTDLSIGDPKYLVGGTFVTSSTPLALTTTDGGATSVGVARVEFRLDGAAWTTYATPFTAAGEGAHVLEFRSIDLLWNLETARQETFVVDDTPPSTTAKAGTPRYASDRTYVTSSTPIAMTSADGGAIPVGLASIEYRVGGGAWVVYATPLALSGTDGPRTIEYRGTDRLGNAETTRTLRAVLDNTPPTTDIASGAGPFTPETRFSLTAADAGCGVNRTTYRIDGGGWTPYAGPFMVPEGEHAIRYRSVDNLGNAESEQILNVTIEVVFSGGFNWKPLVAAVFTVALLAAGAWSSRRAPWRGEGGRRAALKALAVFALPFVALEAGTGVVSLLTGLLSIPPMLGAGTAVDSAILVAGLAVAAYRGGRARAPDSRPAGR